MIPFSLGMQKHLCQTLPRIHFPLNPDWKIAFESLPIAVYVYPQQPRPRVESTASCPNVPNTRSNIEKVRTSPAIISCRKKKTSKGKE